jgi:hypothetical protein
MSKKVAIFYHNADLDGKLSGSICYEHLRKKGFDIDLIPWDYHFKLTNFNRDQYEQIWIVDLSIPELLSYYDDRIVWIDHHKSAIEKYSNQFNGLRIDGIAACRLCWAYFYAQFIPNYKNDFDDIVEPTFVRLAGEYDVFEDKESDYHFFLNFAISHKDFFEIKELYRRYSSIMMDDEELINGCEFSELFDEGEKILEYIYSVGTRSAPLTIEVDGKKFRAINTNISSSLIFKSLQTSNYYGMCVFHRIRSDGIKMSFYANPGSLNDMSQVAKKFGGGGHRGAAGCVMSVSEFYKQVKFHD